MFASQGLGLEGGRCFSDTPDSYINCRLSGASAHDAHHIDRACPHATLADVDESLCAGIRQRSCPLCPAATQCGRCTRRSFGLSWLNDMVLSTRLSAYAQQLRVFQHSELPGSDMSQGNKRCCESRPHILHTRRVTRPAVLGAMTPMTWFHRPRGSHMLGPRPQGMRARRDRIPPCRYR